MYTICIALVLVVQIVFLRPITIFVYMESYFYYAEPSLHAHNYINYSYCKKKKKKVDQTLQISILPYNTIFTTKLEVELAHKN